MKVKCNVDTKKYNEKPKDKETGIIQNRLAKGQTEVEIEELALLLSTGATFKPALLSGSTNDSWVSQQLYALDFDDGVPTIAEAMERCKMIGIMPCIAYTTFSYTEELQKFRLVFCCNTVITDLRVRDVIQKALLNLFKKADKVTRDPARLFFGGKNLIKTNFNSTFNVYELIQKMIATMKKEDSPHYTRNIANFCQDCGLNMINGQPNIKLILNLGNDDFGKNNARPNIYTIRSCGELTKIALNFKITKNNEEVRIINEKGGEKVKKIVIDKVKEKSDLIRNFDFEALKERCQLYKEYINNIEWFKYPVIFGITTNLCKLEGGEKKMLGALNDSDLYISNGYNNLYNTITNTKNYNYDCSKCDIFCPYKDVCKHNLNMLQQVDLKMRGVRKVEDSIKISLKEAEGKLIETFNNTLNSAENNINVIKAPTGIGKTKLYTECDLANTMIVVPTHKLLEEVAERLTTNGVDFIKALKRPIIPDVEVEKRVVLLYKKGAKYSARQEIEAFLLKTKKEANKNKRPLTVEEKAVFEYSNNQNELKTTTKTILATHEKMLYIANKNIKTVIIDEDIMQDSIFAGGMITLTDFYILKGEIACQIKNREMKKNLLNTVEIIIKNLENSQEHLVADFGTITINDEALKELDKVIAKKCNDLSDGIIDFINCNNFLRLEDDCFLYKTNRAKKIFDINKKYIILSATASNTLYSLIAPNRLKFVDIGLVEQQGDIVQYVKKSFSRASIKENMEKSIEEIKEKVGDMPIITYKLLEDNKIAKEQLNIIMHFGATAGIDTLKGQDIAIVGTPHCTNNEYVLTACSMGYKPTMEDQRCEYQQIKRNGYEFFFNTYEDATMQEIQLWMIESELLQAVGRARTLRTDAKVTIYSNLPLESAKVIDI